MYKKKSMIVYGKYYNEKALCVACYVRVSKDNGSNVDNQKLLVGNVAEVLFNGNYAIYVDINYSGTDNKRPGLDQIMDMARNHQINTVIFQDVSRIGRNAAETIKIIKELLSLDIRIISINDEIDTSKEVDMQYIICLAILAEVYPKNTGKNIKNTLKTNVESGIPIYRKKAYGYMRDPKDKHHIIIDMNTASNVLKIFERYAELKSVTAVAKELQENKVLKPTSYREILNGTKKEITKSDYRWNDSTVYTMLRNQVYIGNTVCFHSSKYFEPVTLYNTHEPIIPEQLFNKVQSMLG